MKASYGFVLLSLLFAFSWGKYIQRTRLGIPKQAVREESTDVQPVEQTVFQVKQAQLQFTFAFKVDV